MDMGSMKVSFSGNQPELETMFRRQYDRLVKSGDMKTENRAGRLTDRRPVPIAVQHINWSEPTVKKKANESEAYSHHGLTARQLNNRTSITLGKARDMEKKYGNKYRNKSRRISSQMVDFFLEDISGG